MSFIKKIFNLIKIPLSYLFGYVLIILFGFVKAYQLILASIFEVFSYIKFVGYKISNKRLEISSRQKHPKDKPSYDHEFISGDGKFIYVDMIKNDHKSKNKIKYFFSENKEESINHLKKFFKGTDLINYPRLKNQFKELDSRYKLNLFQTIIDELRIPNFIKTDIELWENIAFMIHDCDEREEAISIELPGDGSIEDLVVESLNLRAFKKIAMESDFSNSIKLRLLYDNAKFKQGYGGASKRFGNWVHMLERETNHFLSLATLLEQSIHKTKNNLDVELFTRQVFYCLIMAADTELSFRFSKPLKKFIKNKTAIPPSDERMSEFSKFLNGKHPPTLAGVGRALNVIKEEKFNPQSELSRLMHIFIESSFWLDSERILNGKFIDYLFRIGTLRGTIMHPSDLNEEDMFDAIDFLTSFKAKGHFYYHVGIDLV